MTIRASSKLDIAKLAKVRALMTGGSTEGERSAARQRAEAMAARAGMTIDEALSSLDTAPKPQAPNIFAGFDDWMEDREPGWKADRAREHAERLARDAVRRAAVLEEYGSEAGLFAYTEREALLHEAIAPLVTKWRYWTDGDGKQHRYAKIIDGMDGGSFWSLKHITPSIRDAVKGAYAWPSTLDMALREVKAWDRLRWDRGLFAGGEWSHYAEVECRISLLEHDLGAGRPAASWDDLQARFDWKRYEEERQWIDPTEREDTFLDRLEADFAALRQRYEAGPQSAPRTTAEKRAAVLSMLDNHPDMSDREIARRIGVSPQTVNTWRKKRGSAAKGDGT
ncbi:winged helix-turn-helix domain-containing protein [Jiella pelagia]|uniref:Winged helix-turn-helix domain-containing protein n=1 Tax=Jiella pelagia TaxID=2986949 RepID=A0ABY7BZU7_9HYPH|nr:winged helix-turn-helix domain-containing protein [Jiella pelagia]WAP69303.1 winged helix-turn-helix domain-containing protein [Jiella pelagia]